MSIKPSLYAFVKGNLATPYLKIRFWRITHFRAAISRIGRRRFVNISTTYLNIKIYCHLTSQENVKRSFFFSYQSVLNFLVVR